MGCDTYYRAEIKIYLSTWIGDDWVSGGGCGAGKWFVGVKDVKTEFNFKCKVKSFAWTEARLFRPAFGSQHSTRLRLLEGRRRQYNGIQRQRIVLDGT